MAAPCRHIHPGAPNPQKTPGESIVDVRGSRSRETSEPELARARLREKHMSIEVGRGLMGQSGVPTGQSLPIVAPRIIAFGLPVTAVTAKRDSGCRICRMKTDNMQSTDAARGMDALPYPALHGVSSCPSNSSTRWWPYHSWLYSRWLAKLSCDHAAESTVLAPGGRPRHVGKKTARNSCRIPCRVKSWPI